MIYNSSSIEYIAKVIPAFGSAKNPIDLVGDADASRFEKVLNEVLITKPRCHLCCYMCTPSATINYHELAKTIVITSKDKGLVIFS